MAAHFQDETITNSEKSSAGPYGNNAYLLVCPQTNESIVIDAPPDPGALIEGRQGRTDVKGHTHHAQPLRSHRGTA